MTSTLQVGGPDWIERHLKAYLATDGAEGHLLDFRPGGGREQTPTLILKTVGRRSGQPHMTPLIYGRHGHEIVVIASKGGAPEHPAARSRSSSSTRATRWTSSRARLA